MTTSKVNIYKDILDYNAGFVCNNNSKNFSEIIEKFIGLNKKKNKELSINSLKCFNKNYNLNSINNMLAIFLKNQK